MCLYVAFEMPGRPTLAAAWALDYKPDPQQSPTKTDGGSPRPKKRKRKEKKRAGDGLSGCVVGWVCMVRGILKQNYGGAAEVLEGSFNVTARASSKVSFSKVLAV